MSFETRVGPVEYHFVEILSSSEHLESYLHFVFDNRVRLNQFFNYQVESFESFRDYMVEHFSKENRFLFVVESSQNSELLGSLGASINGTNCELTYVMKFQNSKSFSFSPIFGHFLEGISKNRDLSSFSLYVRRDNLKAIAFYRKFGFIAVGSESYHHKLLSMHKTNAEFDMK